MDAAARRITIGTIIFIIIIIMELDLVYLEFK